MRAFSPPFTSRQCWSCSHDDSADNCQATNIVLVPESRAREYRRRHAGCNAVLKDTMVVAARDLCWLSATYRMNSDLFSNFDDSSESAGRAKATESHRGAAGRAASLGRTLVLLIWTTRYGERTDMGMPHGSGIEIMAGRVQGR